MSNRESDGPHRAVSAVDCYVSASLLDKAPHQAKTVALALDLGFESRAVVADRQDSHLVIIRSATNGNVGRSRAIRKGVVEGVRNKLCDNDAQRRYRVEIEKDRLAVAGERDVLARPLEVPETAAKRLHVAAEIGRAAHLVAEQVLVHLCQRGDSARDRPETPAAQPRPRSGPTAHSASRRRAASCCAPGVGALRPIPASGRASGPCRRPGPSSARWWTAAQRCALRYRRLRREHLRSRSGNRCRAGRSRAARCCRFREPHRACPCP